MQRKCLRGFWGLGTSETESVTQAMYLKVMAQKVLKWLSGSLDQERQVFKVGLGEVKEVLEELKEQLRYDQKERRGLGSLQWAVVHGGSVNLWIGQACGDLGRGYQSLQNIIKAFSEEDREAFCDVK